MFRKVVQRFTNAATKPGCLGPFQRSLPQQEPALPNAYESNGRNVTGLSDRKNTTKVQQLETFPTQYIGTSKFLFGRIPAGGSSGIVKLFPEWNVQFKKLGGIARLDPALCHSESQPVGFGANQQAVKNILAEREKSDILSGTWGLMQNPISHSFREGEMTKKNEQGASENQQLKACEGKNNNLKIKLQESENKNKELKEELDRKISEVNTLTKGKEQLEENLNSTKQSLDEKDKELKNKNKELESKAQELEALYSENESQVKDLQKQLKSKNKELEDSKDSKASAVNAQGVKSKVNYASASFILSGVCAVGASLATPYLAICAILAVAASVFLALGCHCLYKANTALSDVKVDQLDNQQLLGSSL